MNTQLQETLAALASKLGTSLEKLWPVLVAKERLDSYMGLCFGFGGGVLLAYAVYYMFRNRDRLNKEFPVDLGVLVCGVLSLMLIMIGLANIPSAVYPEAAALKALLGRM